MSTVIKDVTLHIDHGHPGVWGPGTENDRVRGLYDAMLANGDAGSPPPASDKGGRR